MSPAFVLENPLAAQPVVVADPATPSPRRGARAAFYAFGEACCGVVALVVGLAVLATAPLLQIASLGYLLESSARVARSGRLREGFWGIRQAARVGGAVGVVWLMLLLPRYLASLWSDALLIDPRSDASRGLGVATLLASLWVVWHASAAVWRGGRFWHFLWPRPIGFIVEASRRGEAWGRLKRAFAQVSGREIAGVFAQGVRGALVAICWLLIPTALLARGAEEPGAALVGIALLGVVALYLPILQVRAAATRKFRQGFNLVAVWRDARRAPIAHLIATVATLALSVPLYLLKIEQPLPELYWLPNVVFVAAVWPSRLIAGWAAGRALGLRGGWVRAGVRWFSLLALLAPIGLVYAAIVFLTQYAAWYGADSLLQQHAFLLPAPFLPR